MPAPPARTPLLSIRQPTPVQTLSAASRVGPCLWRPRLSTGSRCAAPIQVQGRPQGMGASHSSRRLGFFRFRTSRSSASFPICQPLSAALTRRLRGVSMVTSSNLQATLPCSSNRRVTVCQKSIRPLTRLSAASRVLHPRFKFRASRLSTAPAKILAIKSGISSGLSSIPARVPRSS